MLLEKEITEIKELLSVPKKITIISHRNPDGDAMGSSLGLLHFLKQLNHEVIFISPNAFPDFLAWLPNTDNVIIFEREYDKALPILQNSDIIFTLDFNALHRTGDAMQKTLETLTNLMIMIDHHQLPDDYAKYTFSDVNYGSTCQMVYDFINTLGYNQLINQEIAVSLLMTLTLEGHILTGFFCGTPLTIT